MNRPRRGMSLAVVLLVLTIVFGFSFFVSDSAIRSATISQNEMWQKAAGYAAEAGASVAYSRIKADSTYAGTSPQGSVGTISETALSSMADCKYLVTIYNNSGGSGSMSASDGTTVNVGYIYVISRGRAYLDGADPSSRVRATRTCSVMLQVTSQPVSLFNFAAFGDQGLTVTQGAVMDAYSSAAGAYGSANNGQSAQVGSNTTVTTSGGITLPGDAVAGGGFTSSGSLNIKGRIQTVGNVTLGGAGTIGGNVTSSAGSVTLNNSVTINGTVAAGTSVVNTNAPTVKGDVTAVGAVSWTGTGATINGNVRAGTTITLKGATVGSSEAAVGTIDNTTSTIAGTARSNASISFHNWGDQVLGMTTAPSITKASSGAPNTAGGQTLASGAVTAPAPPAAPTTVTLPVVDTTAAQASNANSTITVSAAWSTTGSSALSTVLDNQNNLNITQGQTVTLRGGTYFFKSLTLANSGSPQIKIDPSVSTANPVKIYVSGNISVAGGSINNSTQVPGNLQIYCASTTMGSSPYAVALSGSSSVYAALYCPKGSVNLSASGAWFGSIVSGSFTSSGGAAFHYDTELLKLTQQSSSGSTPALSVLSWDRH